MAITPTATTPFINCLVSTMPNTIAIAAKIPMHTDNIINVRPNLAISLSLAKLVKNMSPPIIIAIVPIATTPFNN